MVTRTFAALALLAAAPIGATAATDMIPDQKLRYEATYDGKAVGHFEFTIRGEDRGYVVTSSSDPVFPVSLLVKPHHSQTRFVHRPYGATPVAGREWEGEEAPRSYRVDFAAQRIEFSDGAVYHIAPHDRFEAATFPLQLMLRQMRGAADLDGLRVREVSPKRVRNYMYGAAVEESITVPAGTFTAHRITRRRADRPEDTVTAWLTAGADPQLLKITVNKKDKITTLQLVERHLNP